MKRYFIYDAKGAIAGNVKGYRTYKGAQRQADYALYPKLEKIGEEVHNADRAKGYTGNSYLVATIRLIEV